jgi:serine/threonine protein kinase
VPPPLEAGAPLSPAYRVIGHVHRSNVLDVYDVWSEERACRCVAKLLRPDRAGRHADRERLLREGELLQRLAHPHVVRAYELLREPAPILILETLPGATLARAILDQGRLRVPDVVLLGLQLASAMHYLHRHAILHLDLKPSNVVVAGGLAKVIDLSIARPPGPGRAGQGTRHYLAPEQARGDDLGPAADIWGIGAVLSEALLGAPPFPALRGKGCYAQLERRADPVRRRRRVPSTLGAMVDACLDPDPAGRPTSLELMHALAGLA